MLVEKGDLSSGTSGRYHGLLHSGARYATSDLETAKDCMTENLIVRRILPGCVDDTGGMFVLLPGDDHSFVEKWIAGCRAAGIPSASSPRPRHGQKSRASVRRCSARSRSPMRSVIP